MELSLSEAERLATDILEKQGYSREELASPVAHILDCALRGLDYAGFSRILSIVDRIKKYGRPERPMTILRESPVSAQIDGADRLGYIVGQKMTDLAIEKAEASGIAIIGAQDTWYTGMLSFYAEQVTARGLVVLIASNAAPWVAPYGGTEGRFGTNPICAGFPSSEDPIIWDIGTSDIIHAQVVMAKRLGKTLPEGVAYDADGNPTTDPIQALQGAFTAWGGHRGSGLAIVVQLFGIMAGSMVIPDDLAGFGMVMIAMRPDLLRDAEAFRADVTAYAEAIRSTRPIAGGGPVRMPFDRSRKDREAARARGTIFVPDEIFEQILALTEE